MALDPGTRIGRYEILAPLGAGGMGEVYRARDTRLEREVAIKALPEEFARDTDRLARFEREAKLVASLSHANIAAIYGLEKEAGASYLALELVEGETLGHRLVAGPLSLRETADIGVQIASAVDAAHERGIIHRDLKPANVMLARSGVVKVLDFGLARGSDADGTPVDLTASPTVVPATAEGVILGTAPYMSPEQARGKAVDRRTDVWAFGCILMECLSGRPTFAGDTVSDVIAHILQREPEWNSLPPSTPPRLRDVIQRCLIKDASRRPRDIGDLGRELSAIALELSDPGRRPAASVSTGPSLAVLYFENLTRDPENDYFCTGITEDILTDLSKIKGLRVASRNAVRRYRGAPVEIARVARELGVQAVLEGSVRRAGDRVRITTQLVNASDGFQLWAERFDRTLDDVFALQDEIAAAITGALRVTMTPSDVVKREKERPKDAQAYDLYLKGREQYSRYEKEAMLAALDLFRQAIDIDPGYALAWAGMADSYGQQFQWEWAEDLEEVKRLGLEAARKAVALNPQLAEAHKAEALMLRTTGDEDGAREALMRAIKVNPRFTPALINLAVYEFATANLAATERLIRRAQEIDPQDGFATGWLGFLLVITGRPDEAEIEARRERELSGVGFYVTAAWALRIGARLDRGEIDEAMQAVREGKADGSDPCNMDAMEALVAARSGRLDDARRLVHQAVEGPSSLGGYPSGACAAAAVRVGEPEIALRILGQRNYADLAHTLVRIAPELHPLLDHEPFAPRLREATLVWPLQAPMIDEARFALFREVRIESGRPAGSDILRGLAGTGSQVR